MIFHENRLPADDSHEMSCLICYFWKRGKIWNCPLLHIIDGALWVNNAFTSANSADTWDPRYLLQTPLQISSQHLNSYSKVANKMCMLSNFSCFCCHLLTFCRIYFLKIFFQEHYHSGKQFGSAFCRSWFGPNCLKSLLANDKKSTLATKEFKFSC